MRPMISAADRLVTRWCDVRAGGSHAPVRLFCFPYAGGDGRGFRNWHGRLERVADVCAVRLPGRGTRLGEPPYTDARAAVDAMVPAIERLIDRPFALFGYSMGALIAYELARALEPRHLHARALIVAACAAPHVARERPPTWHLPTAAFLERLQELNGTSPGLVDHPDLMALFLPLLRADVQLVETYAYKPAAPLSCPITAYSGAADPHAPRAHVERWAELTASRFRMVTFPGDHFFIRTAEASLLRSIEQTLATA